jgi:hypothetical protein
LLEAQPRVLLSRQAFAPVVGHQQSSDQDCLHRAEGQEGENDVRANLPMLSRRVFFGRWVWTGTIRIVAKSTSGQEEGGGGSQPTPSPCPALSIGMADDAGSSTHKSRVIANDCTRVCLVSQKWPILLMAMDYLNETLVPCAAT